MDFGNVGSMLSKARREAEERDAERRADKAKLPYLNLTTRSIETDALELVLEDKARASQVATIEYKGNQAVLAVYDPVLPLTRALIQELEGRGIKLKIIVVS